MTTVKQIERDQLRAGAWYVGRGRNGNVGLWNGRVFLVIGRKFGESVIKREPCYTATGGSFQPFRLVDEGKMMEPFGRAGWDAHHGVAMEFG